MNDSVAQTVMARCDALGRISEDPQCLVRRYGTPAMEQANALVREWMQAAGMTVSRDQIGNVRGRYAATNPDAPTLLLGSHLDTVRDAGRYDGMLGVIVAIAAVEELHLAGQRLPFAIEVVAFADEEGTRYHTAYLGSAALAGLFDSASLTLTDADGITLAEAIGAFGGDSARIAEDYWQGERVLGYCEVHIEQGPVLEAHNLPVGLVTAITGQSRIGVQFRGFASHAGTTPMEMRHDALCGAAELVIAAETLAHQMPGLVATVGQLSVYPSVSNVVPGNVDLTLDVRHQEDAVREQACELLYQQAQQIGDRRKLQVEWQVVQEKGAVACDPYLMTLLAQSIAETGQPVQRLPSGAGHDGVVMSAIAPVAMLFVRCAGGVSHNPAESVQVDDVEVAFRVLQRFLHHLAHDVEQV